MPAEHTVEGPVEARCRVELAHGVRAGLCSGVRGGGGRGGGGPIQGWDRKLGTCRGCRLENQVDQQMANPHAHRLLSRGRISHSSFLVVRKAELPAAHHGQMPVGILGPSTALTTWSGS